MKRGAMRQRLLALSLLTTACCPPGSGSAPPPPPVPRGPAAQSGAAPTGERGEVVSTFSGRVSYYADSLAGNRTANGEVYRLDAMTAAHRKLPFGTWVRVTRRDTGKSVLVRINDRIVTDYIAQLDRGDLAMRVRSRLIELLPLLLRLMMNWLWQVNWLEAMRPR